MTDFITDVFTKISRIKKAPIFLPSSPVSVVSPREPVPTLPPRPVISAPEPTVEVSAPKMEEKIPSIVLRKVPTPKVRDDGRSSLNLMQVRVLHPGTPKSRERATKRSAPAQSTDPIQQILVSPTRGVELYWRRSGESKVWTQHSSRTGDGSWKAWGLTELNRSGSYEWKPRADRANWERTRGDTRSCSTKTYRMIYLSRYRRICHAHTPNVIHFAHPHT